MLVRAIAVFALVFVPFAVRAADEEHPYKNAKVGDFATYKMTTKVGALSIDGTITQTVTAASDKDVTIKTTGSTESNGKKTDLAAQEQKIDLTKPFDPTKPSNLPGGSEAKVEKGEEGKEKVKVGGKDYDTTWTTHKVKTKAMGQEIDATVKVWMAKDVSVGLVKMTVIADAGAQKMEMTLELTATGNKK